MSAAEAAKPATTPAPKPAPKSPPKAATKSATAPASTSGETAGDEAGRDKTRKRKLVGVVVSDKMDKTRVVLVERRFSHLKYGKFLTGRAKYKAHDEKNEYKTGDKVVIIESRPLSRDKRWKVIELLERPQEA